MPISLRRITIALQADLLAEVDQLARERGESRSRFVRRLLRQAVQARRDAEITQRLDELFADPVLAEAQRQGAVALDHLGTAWRDERW